MVFKLNLNEAVKEKQGPLLHCMIRSFIYYSINGYLGGFHFLVLLLISVLL